MHLESEETKSISEHIKELRKKILFSLIFFTLGASVTHIFNEQIIKFLLSPTGGKNLIFLSPLDPIFFIFKIDIIGGLIISFPIIMWSLISYIKPAITKKINNILFLLYTVSIFLIIASLVYAFFVTIPISLKFLMSINIPGIENSFSAEKYLSFFIAQSLIIMIIFQMPIIMSIIIYLKIFKTDFLAEKRRYIYTILLIALAIITPTTDIFSLSIVFVPCIVIFEISLIGGKIIEKFNNKKNNL